MGENQSRSTAGKEPKKKKHHEELSSDKARRGSRDRRNQWKARKNSEVYLPNATCSRGKRMITRF